MITRSIMECTIEIHVLNSWQNAHLGVLTGMVEEAAGLPVSGDVSGWDPVAKRVFITGGLLVHSNFSVCAAL